MTEARTRLTAVLADRYQIERELGSGGMATVYLAEDVRHHRKVALKVLRPELAAVIGAERFLQEIEVTAGLQHPHILPLHDSGAADGFLYYVMPYVEGESLRARLVRERQLGIPEAIELARQAASALDYAHRRGVIHRDIKPENILIHDRQALIADFGIALAVSTAGGSRMTETGMSLGTPHYMSPEQAMGDRAVDARSDVYALGCVLYEMLVGEPPFTGPTAQAIVAKVITERAPLVTAARETTPAHLAAAIQKSLAKLPADRFATAAEFAEALANPQFFWTGASTATLPAAAPRWPAWQRALLYGAGLAGLIVAFWLGGRLLAPAPAPPPVLRTTLSLVGVQPRDGGGSPLALSPDGSRLVFLGNDSAGPSRLYLRELNQTTAVALAGTEGALHPFFSPDGRWLGYFQGGLLRKLSLAGGAAVTITELPQMQGGSWGRDDRIVFSSRGRLWRVAVSGGAPELLAEADSTNPASAGDFYRWPELLPDEKTVLFTKVHTPGQPVLAALSLGDGAIRDLGQQGMSPRYVDGGYLVFAQSDSTIYAAPFDAGRVSFSGPPQPVAADVRLGTAPVAKMAVSRSGAIAYQSGSASGGRELVLLDDRGRQEVLPLEPKRYEAPAFSPDGKQLVFAISYGGAPYTSDLWTWDLARRVLTRLTFDSASGGPRWSADRRRIIYGRKLGGGVNYGVFWIAPDGSGLGDTLLARSGVNVGADLSPDGKHLLFQVLEGFSQQRPSTEGANWNIWIAPVDSPAAARPLLQNRFNELAPELSPDGRWLAYVSNETGTDVVYLRRLEEGGGRIRVSADDSRAPRWSPDGREFFYRGADSVYALPVIPGSELSFGPRRGRFALPPSMLGFALHPDGRQLVFVRPPPAGMLAIELVLNWFGQPR